jgi:hypothetical protein
MESEPFPFWRALGRHEQSLKEWRQVKKKSSGKLERKKSVKTKAVREVRTAFVAVELSDAS